DRDKTIVSLEQGLQWKEETLRGQEIEIGKLAEAVEWHRNQVVEKDRTIASHEEALNWRAGQVEMIEREKASLITHLQNTQRQFNNVTAQLEAIHASSGWKLILKLRYLRDSLRRLISPGKSHEQQ